MRQWNRNTTHKQPTSSEGFGGSLETLSSDLSSLLTTGDGALVTGGEGTSVSFGALLFVEGFVFVMLNRQ
jgi:hypothetical protein